MYKILGLRQFLMLFPSCIAQSHSYLFSFLDFFSRGRVSATWTQVRYNCIESCCQVFEAIEEYLCICFSISARMLTLRAARTNDLSLLFIPSTLDLFFFLFLSLPIPLSIFLC